MRVLTRRVLGIAGITVASASGTGFAQAPSADILEVSPQSIERVATDCEDYVTICAALLPPSQRSEFLLLQSQSADGVIDDAGKAKLENFLERARKFLKHADRVDYA